MSKKSKTATSIPEIYQGLTRNAENLKCCLVEDIHNQFYAYKTPAEVLVIKQAIFKKWDNWESFSEENEQTILAYHDTEFGQNPPKGQDILTTSIITWHSIINDVENKTAFETIKVPTLNGRKSNIGLSEYRRGEAGTGTIKTPQALACLRLFDAALEKYGQDSAPDAESPGRFITEVKLRDYVIENASDLKTRQDPWRIFQYYRPSIIADKLIRRK